MNWTTEQLEEVEEWAKHAFTIPDISIALDIEQSLLEKEFLDRGPFYKAYKKGVLVTELEMRKSVFSLAKMGHADSQKRAKNYLIEQKTADE